MKENSIFLRSGTLVPKKAGISGQSAYEGWESLSSNGSEEIGTKLTSVGWHFMWLAMISSGVGVGFTPEAAIDKAMGSGLDQLNPRFNTAELIKVTVRKYPGFHVAHVRLESRQIQECASLGLVDEAAFRYFPNAAVLVG